MTADPAASVRRDWERRISLRSERRSTSHAIELPAPTEVTADPGVGQITLRWSRVEGAAGYVISRADHPDGPFLLLDHGGSDVLGVPGPPYADTDVLAGQRYAYIVAAVIEGTAPTAPWSDPVVAESRSGAPEPVQVDVDAARVTGRLDRVWSMVGSERLSQLTEGEDGFGNDIGREVRDALVIGRDELGVQRVRAHGILHDDLRVLTWDGDRPRFDFEQVDSTFDVLVGLGLQPVVELGFMPRDLARDAHSTVFGYQGVVSPPRDWDVWGELCGSLAAHLVERYGIDNVAQWGFEVWNEPNLEVFWTGTQAEYFRLYAEAARAIKAVDQRLQVGGPATAAAEWLEDFVTFVSASSLPLDFLTTHTYGNIPLDARPTLRRHGLGDIPIWWTEWGVGAGHSDSIHGTAFDAPFLLRGYKSVQGRVELLSHWVISDHFEELGRPHQLFHNGFGLLTVGNLRKPRFWAQRMAHELGDEVLGAELRGDGGGSLVDAWATRTAGGRVDVLIWNGAPNTAQYGGNPVLDRTVRLRVSNLADGPYVARLARIDDRHSNVAQFGVPGVAWPNVQQWHDLRARDHLDERVVEHFELRSGCAEVELQLPMPGVARLRLDPAPDEQPARPS